MNRCLVKKKKKKKKKHKQKLLFETFEYWKTECSNNKQMVPDYSD